jgi:DNA repair protein RadC
MRRVSDLIQTERPRERMLTAGAQALSGAELLAILLGTGTPGVNAVELGQSLLSELGGLPGLHRASLEDLCKRRGIGPAKAAQLKAAVELGRRLAGREAEARPLIDSPADAADLLRYEMGVLEQEELRVLLLDTRNRLMKTTTVYRGSLNMSWIRIGEVFREAIRTNAASIIVAHNHPSGDPQPSPEDVAVTRALVEAGKLLDIEVLDHLIIGRSAFTSLKSRGVGFPPGGST